ncbi:MAG: lysophospholipid acyltransferase family protein [Thermoanaerobaculia bacterium]|nr:lysophospholipid acyltransferase family protein [Thermoanaerobaculia bacterium]
MTTAADAMGTDSPSPAAKPSRRRLRFLWRRIRAVLLSAMVTVLGSLLSVLGWSASQSIGRTLGRLFWALSSRERRRALDHLAIAFPALAEDERQALGRHSFLHLGSNLTECLYLWRRPAEEAQRFIDVEDFAIVETARSENRPVLFLTGHCGNWELLAPVLNARGIELAAVVRGMSAERLNAHLNRFRAHFGTEIIERGAPGSARRLLGVLSRGGSLTLLIDQDIQAEGVWVPFFGRPAFTAIGAAQIAIKQKALVIPAFLERLPNGRHLARFESPLDLPPDAAEATAIMTRSIEGQIRRCPDQWVWMHRRWRRQPPTSSA